MNPSILDSLVAPLWLGANALLGFAAWRLTGTHFSNDGIAERTIHCIVLGWACIAGSATALGLIWMLNGYVLLVAVALASGILLLVARPIGARGGAPGAPWDIWSLLWLYVCCCGLVHVGYNGLGGFPRDWDSLHYHIPMITQWLHARSLYAPAGDHWHTPGNNELLGLWMVAPFSGDFLIGLTNLPSVVLLACSSLSLGMRLGLSRALRNIAALIVVGNSVVTNQLVDQENDVAVAALFLCSLLYGMRALNNCSLSNIIMGSVSLGLLSGVKYYALGYTLVAFSMILTFVLLNRHRHSRALAVSFLIGGMAIWGGYWYMRNMVVGGSPIYPLFASDPIYKNPKLYHSDILNTSFISNLRFDILALYHHKVLEWLGPFHFVAFAAMPGSITWLVGGGFGLWPRTKTNEEEVARGVCGLLLAASGLVLAVTPCSVENYPGELNQLGYGYAPARFGLSLLSLAILGNAAIIQDIIKLLNQKNFIILNLLYISFFIILISLTIVFINLNNYKIDYVIKINFIKAQLINYRFKILISLIIFFISLIIISLLKLKNVCVSSNRMSILLTCIVAGIAVALAVGWLSREWHNNFCVFYDRMFKTEVFSHLSEIDPTEVRLAVFRDRSYPFFGSARQFEVLQPLPGQAYPSHPWLLAILAEKNVNLLAVQSQYVQRRTRYVQIDGWISKLHDIFNLKYESESVNLYIINLRKLESIAR